jgi:hypothetical protein
VIRATTTGVRLEVRVTPRSSKTGLDGVRDGRLVVRVNAPPVDDAANAAVVATLAKILGVPKRAVHIVAGQTGRNKSIEIGGVSLAAVERALGSDA